MPPAFVPSSRKRFPPWRMVLLLLSAVGSGPASKAEVSGRSFEGLNGERANTGVIAVTDHPWKAVLVEMMKTNYDVCKVWLGEREPFAWNDPGFNTAR